MCVTSICLVYEVLGAALELVVTGGTADDVTIPIPAGQRCKFMISHSSYGTVSYK